MGRLQINAKSRHKLASGFGREAGAAEIGASVICDSATAHKPTWFESGSGMNRATPGKRHPVSNPIEV